jgi:DNA ligase-1
VYRQTVGACSRHEGEPDVIFYAFDDFSRPALRYAQRAPAPHSAWGRNIKALENQLIRNEDHLLGYEAEILEQGYEGLILRSPDGVYKFGRSTVNQQGMMKLKRFTDGEFLLLDIEEEMENQNVAKTNALGRTERSSAQAGLVPKGRAGTLCARDISSEVEFRIGTGLSDADKAWFWKHRRALVARGFVGKYKSFLIGVKDKPRFPVYLGPREKWDL